jgi:hypothetical protein
MVKNNVNSHNLINDIVLEEMDRVFHRFIHNQI